MLASVLIRSAVRIEKHPPCHTRLARCQARMRLSGGGRHESGPSAAPRRLDRGDVDFPHFHHRSESALGFIAASRERVGQHARRDLPGNFPLVFAPPALALLPAITDDYVPVAVGLFLIFGRYLEREGFVMLEHGTAVETETGYTEDCEFHRQHVALLSAGIVAGRMVHGTDRAVGKGCSIEAGSSLGVLVVPQANCVLGHCLAFRFGKTFTPPHYNGWLATPFRRVEEL